MAIEHRRIVIDIQPYEPITTIFHDSNRDFFDTNRKPISATKWHIDRRNATHAIFGEKRLDIWKNLQVAPQKEAVVIHQI